jgi:hypothetical protein
MNNLTKWAIGILALSLLALIWGYNYQDSHKLEGFGAFLGANASTYRFAGFCQIGGAIGLLIGIGLFIGGLVQGGRNSEGTKEPIILTTQCQKRFRGNGSYSKGCGKVRGCTQSVGSESA